MPSPAVTLVGIGGFLKAMAPQRVQHRVLDRLDPRRKVGDQMMRVGIEADDGRVRQKRRDALVRAVRAENLVVHARQQIRLKTADGLRRARNRLADFIRIKPYQRAVAFLNLDDAILDGHGNDYIAVKKALNAVSSDRINR